MAFFMYCAAACIYGQLMPTLQLPAWGLCSCQYILIVLQLHNCNLLRIMVIPERTIETHRGMFVAGVNCQR